MLYFAFSKRIFVFPIFLGLSLNFFACVEEKKSKIPIITTSNEIENILKESEQKLIGLDMYADWCIPCKRLSPMLEKIAEEYQNEVVFYKINMDKNPEFGSAFGVTGIPYVVFLKHRKQVQALMGLYLKEDYIRVIKQYSKTESNDPTNTPNGVIINGVRVIHMEPNAIIDDIYVYRGEVVRFIMESLPYDFSVHIPEFNISKEMKKGEKLEIEFKAKKEGVFDVFCNGNCLAGSGEKRGRIVVTPYKAEDDAKFIEITAKQAKALLEKKKALTLDVRAPTEYYMGHLEGAKLIPLSQLEQRLSEIEGYKNSDVLVYCHSGNRSTVASQILIKNGFKKIANLRHGIIDWNREGYKTLQ